MQEILVFYAKKCQFTWLVCFYIFTLCRIIKGQAALKIRHFDGDGVRFRPSGAAPHSVSPPRLFQDVFTGCFYGMLYGEPGGIRLRVFFARHSFITIETLKGDIRRYKEIFGTKNLIEVFKLILIYVLYFDRNERIVRTEHSFIPDLST